MDKRTFRPRQRKFGKSYISKDALGENTDIIKNRRDIAKELIGIIPASISLEEAKKERADNM